MRKKTDKQPGEKKMRTQKQITVTALVLLSLSFVALLLSNTLYDIFRNLAECNDRFLRLYDSAVKADGDSDLLTEVYDSWQYARLSFLGYVSEHTGDSSYESFTDNGRLFTDKSAYGVADLESMRMLSCEFEDPERSVIEGLRDAVLSSERSAGVYETQDYRYYGSALPGKRMGVLRTDNEDYRAVLDNIYTPHEIVERNLGDANQFVVSHDANGTILQFYDQESVGKPFEECFRIHGSRFLSDYSDELNESLFASYKGKEYVLISGDIIDSEIKIYYGFSINETISNCLNVIIPIIAVMVAMVLLFRAYTYYLIVDRKANRSNVKEGIRFKVFVFALVSLLVSAGGAYFIKTMDGLSYFIDHYRDVMDDIRYVSEDSTLCEHDLKAVMDQEEAEQGVMVAKYLSAHPESRTQETLKELAMLLRLERIILFDVQGRETLSSNTVIGFTISEDMDSSFAKFARLRNGVSPVIGEYGTDPITRQEMQTVGATTKDTNGDVDGFLLMTADPVINKSLLDITKLPYLLDNSVVTDYYQCFMINQQSGLFTYDSDESLIGLSATANGFDEKNLRSDFSEYLTVDGVEYFMSSSILKEDYLYLGIPVARIFRMRRELCLQVMLYVGIILLIIALMERKCAVDPADLPTRQITDDLSERRQRSVILMDQEDTSQLFSMRRSREIRKEKWPYLNAEEKLGTLAFNALLIFSLLIAVSALFFRQIFGSPALYRYIMSESWPRGITVFSISAVVIISVLVFIVVHFMRIVLQLMGNVLTPRAETICNVLSSAMKYISVIGVVYIALNYFGVDVHALSASVGFLALIIGFGARSLITDIIAGVFIIFEKEFQVGDIVEIGGYRGMVKEIGLRTTKLVSWDKNVKILNNHDVSNVINLSMQNSYAVINFTLSVRNSIERIEEVFNRELPLLRAKYPQMLTDPIFAGVVSFTGSRMACRIYVEVDELWRGRMVSILYKELQEICERNDIGLA